MSKLDAFVRMYGPTLGMLLAAMVVIVGLSVGAWTWEAGPVFLCCGSAAVLLIISATLRGDRP